jgi:Adenine deaminase C-terminal domain
LWKVNNAHMQHSLLALVVIPELRISDKGLIDVTRFVVTELFEMKGWEIGAESCLPAVKQGYCGNSSEADVRAHQIERPALRSVKGRSQAAKLSHGR